MKCTQCKKSEMKKAIIDTIVEIPSGPTLKIKKISTYVCPKCGDEMVDMLTAAQINKQALSQLISKHNSGSNLNGKTARWIYKTIRFNASEWENFGIYSYDAFMKAVQRNSTIDRLAALVLLAKAVDYVTGTLAASSRIHEVLNLDKLLEIEKSA